MKYLIICIIISVLSCSNNYYKIIGQDIKEISLEYFNEATFSNKLSLNLTLKDNTYYYGDTLLFNLNFVNTSNENIKVIPKSIISLISCDSITYLPGLQIPINTTVDLNTIFV